MWAGAGPRVEYLQYQLPPVWRTCQIWRAGGSCNYCLNPPHQCVCVSVCVCVWGRERWIPHFFSICWCQALTDMRQVFFTPSLSYSLSHSALYLSFLFPLSLLPASIPLSIPSGLCYLITLPLYQITEEGHKLAQCVWERERERGRSVLQSLELCLPLLM